MQVTETSNQGLKHELKIVVTADEIQAKVSAKLDELVRTVRLPGFRPGKVPPALVKKKYGQAVVSEVVQDAVNDSTRTAMDERKLRPVMQPNVNVTSFDEGKDLEFTVAVETLPDVPEIDYKGITLERPIAPVGEDEIEEALKNIAARRQSSEPAADDYAAQTGDVVVIDFLGKVGGKPFAGGKGNSHPLHLGAGQFIPGFEDQLVGAKKGDERLVKVTFPAEYGEAFIAGKDAEFDVTVNEVRQIKQPTLDDEFAKSMGIDDLAALKDVLKSEIEAQHGQLSRLHVKRALLDKLADGEASFLLPEGMVEAEFQGIWRQFEAERQRGNTDPADVGKDDETLKAEYRAIAERRVRLGLVLAEISNRHNITVAQADLSRAVMDEARRYPGQETAVLRYYQSNPQAMDNLRAPILEDKVIDHILAEATVTDKTVDLAALRADPDADADTTADETAKPAAKPKRASKKAEAAAAESETSEAPAASGDEAPAAEKPKRSRAKASPKE